MSDTSDNSVTDERLQRALRYIDDLEARAPASAGAAFGPMRERARIDHELDILREGLARLIGYYDAAGAVPIAELLKLMPHLATTDTN